MPPSDMTGVQWQVLASTLLKRACPPASKERSALLSGVLMACQAHQKRELIQADEMMFCADFTRTYSYK